MAGVGTSDAFEAIAQRSDALLAEGRVALGATGDELNVPLAPVLDGNLSRYPLIALSAVGFADAMRAHGFSVLTPELSRSLGISVGAIAALRGLHSFAAAVSPLPIASLVQRRWSRAAVALLAGLIWCVLTITTGFVTGAGALALLLVLDGVAAGSVAAVHAPLLFDSYPGSARVRILASYTGLGAAGLGAIVAPAVVALLAGPMELTWRGTFVGLGGLSAVAVAVAWRLRDPGFGLQDTELLRDRARDGAHVPDEAEHLGFGEMMRRLLLVPTVRRLVNAFVVLGIMGVPLSTFLSVFLAQRWDFTVGARGAFFAATGAATIVVLAVFGRRGERAFRRDPALLVRLAAVGIVVNVVAVSLGALMPVLPLSVALFIIGQSCGAAVAPALVLTVLSLLPSRRRPHAAAAIGIAIGAGGLIGALLLSGIDRRFGIGGSIVSLLIPGLLGAVIVSGARRSVNADLDHMIEGVVEEAQIRQVIAHGGHLPMLACRGIDFSYGPVQVLFDVDFTVDDGEMVALLGTNGAGKSTLLKAISGIGLPSAGSVRFAGTDITYLDAERRLDLGITQVPGGRAVFGSLDVVENLRVFGHSIGRDRRVVDEAIERCFEQFPRLAQRKGSHAVALSGGEQQMLGLSKALILQPRLLLIDELSLGLAPVIVGQLLELVRELNEQGTAVVLVEQSVNIALQLVNHAYFMEKGQIRFDGGSADLLARDDLLRAVFLEGVKAAR